MDLELVVVLALASYRVSRLVTQDTVTANLRGALFGWAWDEEHPITVGSGKDAHFEPAPRAAWRTYVYEGLTCPVCLGVWASGAVYAAWRWGGTVGRVGVAVASIAGAQTLITLVQGRLTNAVDREQ